MMASPDEPLDGIESRFIRAADETEWIPLSLTLVEYPQGQYECATSLGGFAGLSLRLVEAGKWVADCFAYVQKFSGDIFGQLLAVISLIPFAIIAGFITLILFRRDLHTVSQL